MSSESSGMKSIWYFVGLMLLWMGALVFIAGVVELVSPSSHLTVLAELHPGLWWGVVMVLFGGIFFLRNRR